MTTLSVFMDSVTYQLSLSFAAVIPRRAPSVAVSPISHAQTHGPTRQQSDFRVPAVDLEPKGLASVRLQ